VFCFSFISEFLSHESHKKTAQRIFWGWAFKLA